MKRSWNDRKTGLRSRCGVSGQKNGTVTMYAASWIELTDGAVVGMIVVRAMAHHDVRLPVANEPRDGAAVLQRRLELAVVDVEHLRGDAEDLRRLLHLRRAAARERTAGLPPVPDVAVGDGDELDVMPERRPLRGRPADPQLGVVRMRAERDDPELAVLRARGQDASEKCDQQNRRDPPQHTAHHIPLCTWIWPEVTLHSLTMRGPVLPAIGVAALLLTGDLEADVRRVWAVTDGEKIERDQTNHPAAARNAVWDGRAVRVFGARNEIIAFQVIVEADAGGVRELTVRLPELASATDRITYRPPAADPSHAVSRPIQIFTANYMHVTTSSHASWVYDRASPAAPADPTGWKPVQLVPENARRGRGGFPVAIRPNQNQSIWIEIYIDRTRGPGLYKGTIAVQTDHTRRTLPLELEVVDVTLPDENSMHAMLYY